MAFQAPEAASGPPLAVLSPTETLLLEHIGSLEAELSTFRPPRPPDGWQRVGEVAARLGLRPVTVYRAAREGRIANTKIGGALWVEPVEVRPARKAYKRRD
jgi:hypothetical protein